MLGRKKRAAGEAKKPGTWSQIRQAYTATKETDPRIGLYVAAAALAVLAVFVLLGLLVGHPVLLTMFGLPLALLAASVVFGRRAEAAAYGKIEGQPGAAAAVLSGIRRGWYVSPGIAANRQQDLVHRAVGRAGIVLVGEGAPSRLGALLAQERKKHARIAPDIPIVELQAGDGEGQVPLRRLQRHLAKLPRTITPGQASEVDKRLKAVGSLSVPMPKGPLGRGQVRAPKGMR